MRRPVEELIAVGRRTFDVNSALRESRWPPTNVLGLAAGFVLCILAMLRSPGAGPDAFFAPKELVLVAAGTWTLFSFVVTTDSVPWSRQIDRLLFGALLIGLLTGAVSANRWSALRAWTLAFSAVAVYITARSYSRDELSRRALATAIVAGATLVALSVLFEAYGVIPRISPLGRAPGGLVGNRNLAAHLMSVSLPVALVSASIERRYVALAVRSTASLVILWALLLTRCRAGWIAASISLLMLVASALVTRNRRATQGVLLLAPVLVMSCLLAGLVPNRLAWTSSAPFRDTVANIATFSSGCGKARVEQHRVSAKMFIDSLPLGVGPGNWAVEYSRYVPLGDLTYHPDLHPPINRLPSSDLIALAVEWGPMAVFLVMATAVAGIIALFRRRGAIDSTSIASLCSLVAVIVLSSADAFLQRPDGAFLAALLAAMIGHGRTVSLMPRTRVLIGGLLGFVAVTSTGLFGCRAIAADLRRNPSVQQLVMASRLDPGNYVVQVDLAVKLDLAGQTQEASLAAKRALELFPYSKRAQAIFRSGLKGGR